MNKIALALILLILPFSLVYTSPRKKVGIVLSGGGAKGVAHIGVIKALEELNIPIDYIAGTSIGAIIGGLYSIGYTSEQLETIVKQTDWIDLLTDKVSRKEIPFPFKSDDSKYLISFPINNSGKNGGIIKGKNISQLLHQLTEGYQNVTNFDSLPICMYCHRYGKKSKRGHPLWQTFRGNACKYGCSRCFFTDIFRTKSFN